MKTREDIFYSEDRLCIRLAKGAGALKGYEAIKNKDSALLWHAGELIEISWQSVQVINGDCSLVFMPCPLFDGKIPVPACELASSLRLQSVSLLRSLSRAVELAEDRLYWNIQALPLSSIWFFENGDILLLSRQMGDTIDRFELSEDRHTDKDIWLAHNCEEGYGKAHFMFQLLYYALSKVAPFGSEAVRANGFKAVPLALWFSSMPASGAQFCALVDKALSDDKKFQLGIKHPLSYFREVLDRFCIPEAGTGDSDAFVSAFVPGESQDLESYNASLEKRARIKAFFRTKGFRVSMIALAIAIVGYIAGFYIYRAVKAPETKDLNAVEIVQHYYDSFNRLDLASMEEPMKNGVKSPDEMEISTLFVSSMMQKTYEGRSLVVDPNEWLASGKTTLPQNSMLFGVTDLTVTRLDDATYQARMKLYSSSAYLQEDDELTSADDFTDRPNITIYVYEQICNFSFTTRKTWLEISRIEVVGMKLIDTMVIDYE